MIDIILFSIVEEYAKTCGFSPANLGVALEKINNANVVCAYDLRKVKRERIDTTLPKLVIEALNAQRFLRKNDKLLVVFSRLTDEGITIAQIQISSIWFENIGISLNITQHSSIITR